MSSQATFLTIPSHILSLRGNGILEIFVVAKVHYQHIASYDVTISDIGVGCSSAFKERHSRKGPNLLAPMEIPDLILNKFRNIKSFKHKPAPWAKGPMLYDRDW